MVLVSFNGAMELLTKEIFSMALFRVRGHSNILEQTIVTQVSFVKTISMVWEWRRRQDRSTMVNFIRAKGVVEAN